jgi:hypothetical protein
MRAGPPCYYTQWTIERTISLIEEGFRQHSTPLTNLAHVAERLAQQNVLSARFPHLSPSLLSLPTPYIGLGDGYALLHAQEERVSVVTNSKALAIKSFVFDKTHTYYGCHELPLKELEMGIAGYSQWCNCTFFKEGK